LEHTPKADVKRSLFLIDKLYISSIVSTEAVRQ
jgi:hypothetical protein